MSATPLSQAEPAIERASDAADPVGVELPPFPLPCAPLEHYLFFEDSDSHPMCTYAQLSMSGPFDVTRFQECLVPALMRHPVLHAVLQRRRGGHWEWIASPRMPLLDVAAESEPIRFPVSERIDLTQEPGLRLWLRIGEQRARLVMQIHHSCADGRGKFTFLTDWLALYGRALGVAGIGELPPPNLASLRNRGHLPATKRRPLPQRLADVLHRSVRVLGGPVSPLRGSLQPPQPSLEPDAVASEKILQRELEKLLAVVKQHRVSLTDWLTFALFRTLIEWQNEAPFTGSNRLQVMLPVDIRKGDERGLTACNRVNFTFLKKSAGEIHNENLLERIHVEMKHIRERDGALFLSLMGKVDRVPFLLQRLVRSSKIRPTAVLSSLGRFALQYAPPLIVDGDKWRIGELVVDEVLNTVGVRQGTPIAIHALRYGQDLFLTSRADHRNFDPQQTRDFLKRYVSQILSLANIETPDVQVHNS